MPDLETTEITKASVLHLKNWLTLHGYSNLIIEEWLPGSIEIKANGLTENILVQVKAVLHPNEQAILNGTDKFALKELATRLERKAYAAYLVIDKDKNLIGEIVWERLN